MSSVLLTQGVILAGGAGTRLGELTRSTPKPMLPVAGEPFLAHLMAKAASSGLTKVLVLAGAHAQVLTDWIETSAIAPALGISIQVVVEPVPLGTGGALSYARDRLDETFLLLNGDTWFDFDWRELADSAAHPWMMALRPIEAADRYETVELADGVVSAFHPRTGEPRPGLINGGVYRASRELIPRGDAVYSLENDLLPALVRQGLVGAKVFDAPFIDIGLPSTYAQAQGLLAR